MSRTAVSLARGYCHARQMGTVSECRSRPMRARDLNLLETATRSLQASVPRSARYAGRRVRTALLSGVAESVRRYDIAHTAQLPNQRAPDNGREQRADQLPRTAPILHHLSVRVPPVFCRMLPRGAGAHLKKSACFQDLNGGAEGDRTSDLDIANAGGIERFQRRNLAAMGKRAHARSRA
jgi:hypothetical protein